MGSALGCLVATAAAQEVRLSGRLLDKALMKPVPGAVVRLAGNPSVADTTGADGRFLIQRSSSAVLLAGPAPEAVPLLASRDALGRAPGFGASRWTPAFAWGNLPVTPLRAAPKASSRAAETLEIVRTGLAAKTVSSAEPQKDLGDIVLDYPARRLDIGAPPIYDALVLFDGTKASLDAHWEHWQSLYRTSNGLAATPVSWTLAPDPVDSGMTLKTCCREQYGDQDLLTKRAFRDFQLHVEFNFVSAPRTGGVAPGPANSGTFMQNRYEVQIKDDYGMTLGDHDCGALIRERPSPTNEARTRGKWQAYDITFRAARFSGGQLRERARITVHWNGKLIHKDQELNPVRQNVGRSGLQEEGQPAGLKLQNEGHDVRFRNIWIKDLDLAAANTDIGY